MTQQPASGATGARVEYLNPAHLPKNPAFTQVISVTGPVKTIYIGGQDAVDEQGNIVGIGDIKAQVQQVLANIRLSLVAAGAEPQHLIKWTIYLVQGQSVQEGYAAFQQFWGNHPNPPTITMLYVAGLARPEFLVEIDAVAVVPLT